MSLSKRPLKKTNFITQRLQIFKVKILKIQSVYVSELWKITDHDTARTSSVVSDSFPGTLPLITL